MPEIIKADPKKKKRAYSIVAIAAFIAIFVQTKYFKSLVTIDKAGMDTNQLNEARLLELVYAQLFNAVFVVILGLVAIRMIILGRKSLRDKRYPPYRAKTAIDTQIHYGTKARLDAYLIIASAILLLLSPIIRSYYLYNAYTLIENFTQSNQEQNKSWKKHLDDFISANPKSPQSAYYLYKQGKLLKAEEIINQLVANNIEEGIFAKHTMNISGELYDFNKDDSIAAVSVLCTQYIQPCLFLADYFIEQRNFDEALSRLNKIKHIEHHETYSKLRWLYSVKSWHYYDKEKAHTYAKLITKASKPDCGECTKFSLTEY